MRTRELDDMTINEILTRWPGLMRLFIDRQLLCVGCPIAPFHTLADVAHEHGVDQEELEAAIADAIAAAMTAVPRSEARAGPA